MLYAIVFFFLFFSSEVFCSYEKFGDKIIAWKDRIIEKQSNLPDPIDTKASLMLGDVEGVIKHIEKIFIFTADLIMKHQEAGTKNNETVMNIISKDKSLQGEYNELFNNQKNLLTDKFTFRALNVEDMTSLSPSSKIIYKTATLTYQLLHVINFINTQILNNHNEDRILTTDPRLKLNDTLSEFIILLTKHTDNKSLISVSEGLFATINMITNDLFRLCSSFESSKGDNSDLPSQIKLLDDKIDGTLDQAARKNTPNGNAIRGDSPYISNPEYIKLILLALLTNKTDSKLIKELAPRFENLSSRKKQVLALTDKYTELVKNGKPICKLPKNDGLYIDVITNCNRLIQIFVVNDHLIDLYQAIN